ncbi:MAG: hypothetical protein RSG59_01600 [Ruthenibacterium sp.]
MSILSSLYHGEPTDLPNEVHNPVPVCKDAMDDGTKVYEGSASLTQNAQQRKTALAQHAVRPAMAYSEEELINGEHGAWAPPHTVESQLESKEEMPLG